LHQCGKSTTINGMAVAILENELKILPETEWARIIRGALQELSPPASLICFCSVGAVRRFRATGSTLHQIVVSALRADFEPQARRYTKLRRCQKEKHFRSDFAR
jgi:hypothetical protein